MTENELKAVRFIKSIKNHAMVTLDHIAKEEPNVSPLVYKGREEKADTILAMVEELQQYRAIGTPEECRAAVEKQKAKKPIPIDYEKYMDTVINAQFLRGAYWCPNCRRVVKSGTHCNDCGQKLDWSDEE